MAALRSAAAARASVETMNAIFNQASPRAPQTWIPPALGVTAVSLLIASRTTARGQHVIARLGWVAVPDSFGIAKDLLPKASGATSHTTQASSGRRSSDPLAGRRRAHAAGRNP